MNLQKPPLICVLPLAVVLLATGGCEDPGVLPIEDEVFLDEDYDDFDAEDADEQLVMSEPSDHEPDASPLELGRDGLTVSSDDDSTQIAGYQLIYSVTAAGSTVAIPIQGSNDPAWFLNAPNYLWGELSRVTATIVHDGFLNGPNGWDHLAVITRGTTLESSLQYLGFPSGTDDAFFWGESLATAGAGSPQLNTFIRGRGPTFWAKGATEVCSNTQLPCLKFENYSMNYHPGDVLFGPSVPLSLNAQPFQIKVDTTDEDIKVWVWQGGQPKAYASCLQITGGDDRCGAQAGDGAVGDAAFAVVVQSPVPNFANRHIGVLNSASQILQEPLGCGGPGACQPY